jgi:hypothetical protein
MIYNFRSILPGGKIKGLTFSLKEKAYIRDNAAAGHLPAIALAQARRAGRIKNKLAGFCEIKQCVSNELRRYSPGPVVSESFITPVKYATVK